jgi:hypothetical protein
MGNDLITMSTVDELREDLRKTLQPYPDVITRVRRVYFDRPSFALADKHEVEFEIKHLVADRYNIPFRSVVFTGSAQLGFSPQKDTEFKRGNSDLDIACIDARLFQWVWQSVITATKAFTDLSGFNDYRHAERLQDQLLRRSMILFDYLPRSRDRMEEQRFVDGLSQRFRTHFGRVSIAVYMSEWAFCWKQQSALGTILGYENAK